MTTAAPSVTTESGGRPAVPKPIVAGIIWIAMRFRAATERSRQRRALAQLDDHLLRDIGLTRRDFMGRTSRHQSWE